MGLTARAVWTEEFIGHIKSAFSAPCENVIYRENMIYRLHVGRITPLAGVLAPERKAHSPTGKRGCEDVGNI